MPRKAHSVGVVNSMDAEASRNKASTKAFFWGCWKLGLAQNGMAYIRSNFCIAFLSLHSVLASSLRSLCVDSTWLRSTAITTPLWSNETARTIPVLRSDHNNETARADTALVTIRKCIHNVLQTGSFNCIPKRDRPQATPLIAFLSGRPYPAKREHALQASH